MESDSSQTFEIHQALHGYREGHRLLDSSIRLPVEAERTILHLSDLSGSNPISGFDSYLTGYPLPGAPFYAFARTYYAREMERPGCVWTHTLIISLSDLARIPDLSSLCSLFVRPDVGKRFSHYRRPLHLEAAPLSPEAMNWSSRHAAVLLHQFYSEPEMPLLVPAKNSESWEALVLALWSQQWPRMRRSLCFSTGSLSVRSLGNEPFSLQAVPYRAKSRMDRAPESICWRDLDESPDPPASPWLSALIDDLGLAGRTPLREHFWIYGADVDRGRAAMIPLVETYLWRRPEPTRQDDPTFRITAIEMLERLAQQFRSSNEARRLKQSMVAPVVDAPSDSRAVELLFALATTGHYGAFDAQALDLPRYVEHLWIHNRAAGRQFLSSLLDRPLNPIGEMLLERLVLQVTPEDLPDIEHRNPSALGSLVVQNPSLVAIPDSWRRSVPEQRKLLDRLALTPGLSLELRESIFRAIQSGGSSALAGACVDVLGPEVIGWYLDSLTTASSVTLMPESWLSILRHNPGAVLSWLAQAKATGWHMVALSARLFQPSQYVLEIVPAARWIQWIQQEHSQAEALNKEHNTSAHAFLLALGLQSADEDGAALAARFFDPVHQALRYLQLSDDQWQWFERIVPSGRFYTSRDDRMRRALIQAFIRYSWPIHYLLRAASHPFLLEDLMRSSKEVDGGKALFKAIRRGVQDGIIEATEAQRKVLD